MTSSIKLNKAKYNKLSDICSDIAQVSLASVVVPALVDKIDLPKVILGLIIAITFWILSFLFTK